MRKQIVAGNWKMHNDLEATKALINQIKAVYDAKETVVYIAPAFTNLLTAADLVKGTSIRIAAQNMHYENAGAFTGEISPSMLKSLGVNAVILGHSERRAYFNETNASLKLKVDAAVLNEMTVIFCFGEKLENRNAKTHFNVVKEQITDALFHLNAKQWAHIILAYEPVWAIGTGETATPEQAQEMHAYIRELIKEKYSDELAESVSIIYGGSVKPNNADALFLKPDVDGGLIGGACLSATDFNTIINAI